MKIIKNFSLIIFIFSSTLNAATTLDLSFGVGGIVLNPHQVAENTANLALSTHGYVISGTTKSLTDFMVMQFDFNGNADTSFNNGLPVMVSIGNKVGKVSLGVQMFEGDSERLVLASSLEGENESSRLVLCRSMITGEPDNTFGTNGITYTDVDGQAHINDLKIMADNTLYIAGIMGNSGIVSLLGAHHTSSGILDAQFGTAGIIKNHIGQSFAKVIDIQANGNIILGGLGAFDTVEKGVLLQYSSNGLLDNTFGNKGMVQLELPNSMICALGHQNDNKLVVVARSYENLQCVFYLLRYASNGQLDASFGTDGIVTIQPGVANIYINSMAIQNNNKIVLVGMQSNDALIMRYNDGGLIDTSFGNNGIITQTIGSRAVATAVVVDDDGKIVVAGTSDNKLTIVRYHADNSEFVTVSTPENGSTVSTNLFEISGVASQPNKTLRIQLGNEILATTTTDSAGRWTLGNRLITDGEHTLTAELLDGQTMLATSSNTFTVTPSGTHSISITAPTEGAVVTSVTPTISGNAGKVSADVRLTIDSTLLDTVATDSAGAWSKVASLIVNGAHTVLAELMNGGDVENSDTKNFSVSVPTFITLATPTPRSTITTATTAINGMASDANVELQVLVDGQLFNVVTTDTTGHWDAGMSNALSNGRHAIMIMASDSAGSVRISASTYFTVSVA